MNAMTSTTRAVLVPLLLALPAAGLAASAPLLTGDAGRGAALFRLHCAACHGRTGTGDGPLAKNLGAPAPTDLRDVAFLMQRGDDQLQRAIAGGGRAFKGSFTMPAFAGQLSTLDLWDLVAHIRTAQPSIAGLFPTAVRYTARSFALEGESAARLAPLLGTLEAEEAKVVVAAIFMGGKNEKAIAGEEPTFVQYEPRALAVLKPRQKLGYLSFATLPIPGVGAVPAVIAIDREGLLLAIKPRLELVAAADVPAFEKAVAGWEGQGSKQLPYEPLSPPRPAAPKGKKAKKPEPAPSSDLAKALNRAYLRALEGAVLFDKEEHDRHWAD